MFGVSVFELEALLATHLENVMQLVSSRVDTHMLHVAFSDIDRVSYPIFSLPLPLPLTSSPIVARMGGIPWSVQQLPVHSWPLVLDGDN